jgi:hypothetical protein
MAWIVANWEADRVTDQQLALRAEIFRSFAVTGAPPELPDSPDLRALAEQHAVVLDADGRILMAHPFAAHTRGVRVDAGRRTWWGNCAWDGFGIVHALGLRDATITAQGVAVRVRDGVPDATGVLFTVPAPAARWWDDIADT